MSLARLTSKGQITLPKSFRDQLSLHTGDQLALMIDSHGRIIITAKTLTLDDVFGSVKPKRRGATVASMDKAIAKHIRRKYSRARD